MRIIFGGSHGSPCHFLEFKGGGGWSNFGGIFLMNFELLTFPCREMIKLSIHDVSKINP